MKTILAIDLGKRKSVFCRLDSRSLKPEYFSAKTDPQTFHDLFTELDAETSIVLFEVGSQAGWLSDMLRALRITFKVANVNHSAWKWTNNPNKSDRTDAHRLAMMYHHGFFPDVYIPNKDLFLFQCHSRPVTFSKGRLRFTSYEPLPGNGPG
jgi:transposase